MIETIKTGYATLSELLNIWTVFGFLVGTVCFLWMATKVIKFIARKEIRSFLNLRRKIYLCVTSSEGRDLIREQGLIRQAKLFHVHNTILNLKTDIAVLRQNVSNNGILVVGYSNDFEQYEEILSFVKERNIPLIIFTQVMIDKPTLDLFQSYPYFEMCNTSARLLSTIFNFSVITPYKQ